MLGVDGLLLLLDGLVKWEGRRGARQGKARQDEARYSRKKGKVRRGVCYSLIGGR